MKTSETKNQAVNAVTPEEPEDVARFEGEGGQEAPPPDLVDVPLYNAIWRRPRWAAQQANQQKMTI